MDTNLLEDFICLSDVRNFSRAAEIRNVTQSTLSKRIRNLEHWASAQLIDRSSYPVQLTAEGKVMIRQARALVEQMNHMRSNIREISQVSRDQIGILSLHTLRVTFLPGWLKGLEGRVGKISQAPMPINAAYRDTVRMFRNEESDMLLTYVHPAVRMEFDPDELDRLILGTERLLPVSAPDAEGRPLHDIDREGVVRYLSYGTQSFFAQILTPLLREKLVAVNVVASNAMCVALQSLALVGTGMVWIPESLARDDLAAGRLVQAGTEDWIIETEIAVYRKKGKHRPQLERLWTAARQQIAAATDQATDNHSV